MDACISDWVVWGTGVGVFMTVILLLYVWTKMNEIEEREKRLKRQQELLGVPKNSVYIGDRDND